MRIALLLLTVAFAMVSGCGSHNRVSLGKVNGTVSYRGKPIARGSLVFEVPGARPAHGKIVEGRIVEVSTYAQGDGVPVGSARIAVSAGEPSTMAVPVKRPMNPKEALAHGLDYPRADTTLIPCRYNDPATSGLTWNIVGGENRLDLDLQE